MSKKLKQIEETFITYKELTNEQRNSSIANFYLIIACQLADYCYIQQSFYLLLLSTLNLVYVVVS